MQASAEGRDASQEQELQGDNLHTEQQGLLHPLLTQLQEHWQPWYYIISLSLQKIGGFFSGESHM